MPVPDFGPKADFCFLIFVLSSIAPENHLAVLQKIWDVIPIVRKT